MKRLTKISALAVASALLATLAAARAGEVRPPSLEREFEFRVRSLFFRGLDGDSEAFEAAMRLCDEALDENPDDAEALVWRGSGSLFRAGRAYQQGDWHTGAALWQEGLDEMERAVSLAPDDVSVRIPRGATLIASSRYVASPEEGRRLLAIGIGDYERVLELQKPYFDRLSEHAKGELLIGMAEAYARLDDEASAMATVERIRRELAGSDYAVAVDAALADEAGLVQLAQRTCSGCHH